MGEKGKQSREREQKEDIVKKTIRRWVHSWSLEITARSGLGMNTPAWTASLGGTIYEKRLADRPLTSDQVWWLCEAFASENLLVGINY